MAVSQLIIIDSNTNHQDLVKEYLQSYGTKTHQAPNIEWFNTENESIKIKTIREILQKTSFASYQGKQQFFILLHIDSASIPAQNALLKLIEEPPQNTTIILTTSQIDKILPTITSRCVLQHLPKEKQKATQIDIDQFLKTLSTKPDSISYADIINHVEKYKERAEAQKYIYSQLQENRLQLPIRRNLLEAYRDLDQNSNVRLTLEHYLFLSKKQLITS